MSVDNGKSEEDGRPYTESWWSIAGSELMKALMRVESGQPADLVYIELYANSEHEKVPPEVELDDESPIDGDPVE